MKKVFNPCHVQLRGFWIVHLYETTALKSEVEINHPFLHTELSGKEPHMEETFQLVTGKGG